MSDGDFQAQIDRIEALLTSAADRDYIGEGLSQLEHALQSAALATRAGAPRDEVVAALLHDIGHRCDPSAESSPVGVIEHDELGANFLESLGFGPAVVELVRGHVRAKRYLVATRPDYSSRLSPASAESLRRQGGPLPEVEQDAFRANPWWEARVRLRSWDDAAKVPDLAVPPLSTYRAAIEEHLAAQKHAAE